MIQVIVPRGTIHAQACRIHDYLTQVVGLDQFELMIWPYREEGFKVSGDGLASDIAAIRANIGRLLGSESTLLKSV
jgi:hypothetical protein